jgi:hypothetical protein
MVIVPLKACVVVEAAKVGITFKIAAQKADLGVVDWQPRKYLLTICRPAVICA